MSKYMMSFVCLISLALSTQSFAMDDANQTTGGSTVSHPAPKTDGERIEAEAKRAKNKAKKKAKKAGKKVKKHVKL